MNALIAKFLKLYYSHKQVQVQVNVPVQTAEASLCPHITAFSWDRFCRKQRNGWECAEGDTGIMYLRTLPGIYACIYMYAQCMACSCFEHCIM